MKRFRKIDNQDWKSQAEGVRKANKGKPKSKKHRQHISKSMRKAYEDHYGMVLEAIKCGEDNYVLYFKTCVEAAKYLGCSKQLVSQAVKCKSNRSARGFVFKWVKLQDIIHFEEK